MANVLVKEEEPKREESYIKRREEAVKKQNAAKLSDKK